MRYFVYICIFLLSIAKVYTWSSISDTLKSVGNALVDNTACKFRECCNSEYIPQNMDDLKFKIDKYLYGQHIVNEILLNGLQDHISHKEPQKALAISFHGAPGIGKNYVTKFIVESFYKLGFNSKYVHFYYGPNKFPEQELVKTYQRQLYNDILSALKDCPKQIFIFDEIDKMPRGVLDVLKVFLDTHKVIDNVDVRRAIFIFILNTGGSDIVRIYEDKKISGLHREQLKLYHFERDLFLESFNKAGISTTDDVNFFWSSFDYVFGSSIDYIVQSRVVKVLRFIGGFLFSDVIESHLIDHYIPFLPLDRKHVELCILDEFKIRGVFTPSKDQIKEVMEYVDFNGQFSSAGCKRISAKVGAVIRRTSRSEL